MKARLAAALVVVAGLVGSRLPRSPALTDSQFDQWIERCSEKGHNFISDNWVSNETAYADHLNYLARSLPKGAVYLGVGPEQNFSYIAALQPCYAFIVDIRRGNLLQHLFFKFLFEEFESPQQWLAALLGRPCSPRWQDRPLAEWLAELGRTPADEKLQAELFQRFRQWIAQNGLVVQAGEWEFLERMQTQFSHNGLDIRFEYRTPRPGQPAFPTFRDVLQARDAAGRWGNFLAWPESYRRVRQMQLENRIIPVVGDFAGGHALSEIAGLLRERNLRVGLFYASNVEFYLMPKQLPGAKMERFVFNLEGLPTGADSLLLRTHLADLPGSTPYPHGQPVFVPRIQPLQNFVQRYFQGDLPSYAACMLQDDLSRGPDVWR